MLISGGVNIRTEKGYKYIRLNAFICVDYEK